MGWFGGLSGLGQDGTRYNKVGTGIQEKETDF
jgi:hypothetical protein